MRELDRPPRLQETSDARDPYRSAQDQEIGFSLVPYANAALRQCYNRNQSSITAAMSEPVNEIVP